MANKKQLAILKQGVAVWNKWREENPDAEINLRGAKLDGMDLSGANFSKADIRGANFRNSILIMANFRKTILDGFPEWIFESNNDLKKKRNLTDFSMSNLTRAIFNNAHIGMADFSHAILIGTSWLNSKESLYPNYRNSYYGTIIDDSNIRKLLMRGRGKGLFLKGKNLKGAHLVKFDLRGADLRETNLLQANLNRANLTGAKLYGSAREGWIIAVAT